MTGLYLIHPPNIVQGPWKVLCDQESDGGGWTVSRRCWPRWRLMIPFFSLFIFWKVFQVRDDVEPHENFMRNWEDYKVGFGDFEREFWLGNVLLWALTNSEAATKYELIVDLEDWSGNKRFARYKGFRVGPESDLYRLYFSSLHSANAGDSLFSHNGLPFSTFDKDNDDRDGADLVEKSCARLYKVNLLFSLSLSWTSMTISTALLQLQLQGGWWYGNCHDANLNGWYLGGPHRSFADGINWYSWTGYNYSLRRTRMRLRPLPQTERDDLQFRHSAVDSYLAAHKQGRKSDQHSTDIANLLSDVSVLTKPWIEMHLTTVTVREKSVQLFHPDLGWLLEINLTNCFSINVIQQV